MLAFYFVDGIFLEFGLVAFWADLNTALVMAFHECLAFSLAIAAYPCLFRVELELVLTIRVGAQFHTLSTGIGEAVIAVDKVGQYFLTEHTSHRIVVFLVAI